MEDPSRLESPESIFPRLKKAFPQQKKASPLRSWPWRWYLHEDASPSLLLARALYQRFGSILLAIPSPAKPAPRRINDVGSGTEVPFVYPPFSVVYFTRGE